MVSRKFITAKQFREMSNADILASIGIGMDVLTKRKLDKDDVEVLISILSQTAETVKDNIQKIHQ